jgi:hypothetical protein
MTNGKRVKFLIMICFNRGRCCFMFVMLGSDQAKGFGGWTSPTDQRCWGWLGPTGFTQSGSRKGIKFSKNYTRNDG